MTVHYGYLPSYYQNMFDKETLTARLAARSTKNWVNSLCTQLNEEGYILTDLLDLTLHTDGQIAFHAAWLLDTVVENDLDNYIFEIDLFITYSQRIKHHSCQRHYVRIFMLLTAAAKKSNIIRLKLSQTDLEPMVELCFDWLIDLKTKVAVKAFASEVLCNVSGRYDWISEELQSQLRFLMNNGSPAIQSTGRRLLNKLQT